MDNFKTRESKWNQIFKNYMTPDYGALKLNEYNKNHNERPGNQSELDNSTFLERRWNGRLSECETDELIEHWIVDNESPSFVLSGHVIWKLETVSLRQNWLSQWNITWPCKSFKNDHEIAWTNV